MSGYNPYGQPNNGPTNQQQQAPPGSQFRPPVAPSPYQQQSPWHGQAPSNGQQNQYGGTPYSGYQGQGGVSQEQGYFPPQGQVGPGGDGAMGGLSAQMGNMGLGDEGPAISRPNKKKNRHAYHNLDQPTPTPGAFNSMQQNQQPYRKTDVSQQSTTPYGAQPITPAMNQFPAPAGTAFSPNLQPGGSVFGAPSQQPPAAPSGPGVSAQGRVDPEQIPSVPLSRDAAARYYLEHIYPTIDQHLPPPASVPFVAFDQGNSSPKYARLTLNNIPSTAEALSASGLPLGMVLQPLAPLQEGEEKIPVLDFGETGPPRCRRCRTYINPFMTFRSGGNKLVCNMCTFPNDVAPEYFAPTDPSGVRVDRAQRPELTLGTVEFMVPKEYWAKEPVGLRWLFLIDVSQEALNRGFLEAFCNGVVRALYNDDQEDADYEKINDEDSMSKRSIPLGSKVGFVAYDKAMHYFNCSVSIPYINLSFMTDSWQAKLDQAQMLVMPDVEDPFVPLGSDGLFVDPYESKSVSPLNAYNTWS